jgi:Transposase DDE domain
VSPFIRRVKTSSGATAVQIVEKRGGVRTILRHIGSAHSEAELALLMVIAQQSLHEGQDTLDLGLKPALVPRSEARVLSSMSEILWAVLTDAYQTLGFDSLDDEAFRALVLARLVEPTSKADTVRVLNEIGAPAPHVNTLHTALRRASERDYRDQIARACLTHSVKTSGPATFVLYDVTTLHFENDDEDTLRRVGMSKEHRVDPQVQVGLLVDPAGVPLEMHLFEGNKAETTTLIPVLRAFQDRHNITDIVVVADAGMLSAGNLNALEDAGLAFIVGSRLTKAPYDLDEYFERHGNFFADGQILETARVMGTGVWARERRIVYQWSFTRNKRDDRNINLMITKAERIAAGTIPMRKARFLKVSGARKELDQATIDRARQLAGIKGYVTNLPESVMPGSTVINAYHDLWKVEQSFRMTKSDLKARPVFHHQRDAIEAHLTVIFAALAITRYLTSTTGVSLKKLIRTLRPLRSVRIGIGPHELTAEPQINADTRAILDRLPPITVGH